MPTIRLLNFIAILGFCFIALAFIALGQAAPVNLIANLTWPASTDAGIVRYQISTRINTASPVAQDVAFPTTTLAKTVALATGDVFYVKAAYCNTILCGPWSPEASFTMPAVPGAPTSVTITFQLAP